jgi:hypothetical protein
MKMRMEKLNKTINMVYQASIRFMSDVLDIVEGLLIVNPNQRIKPVIKQEFSITLRDLEYLKALYVDALPIERGTAILDYLGVKYQNDPIELKKYQVLARYYPETLLSTAEARDQIAFGVSSEELHIRAKRAIMAIDELIEETPDFLDLTKQEIFKRVENVINNR